jgi:2-hydroxychromene-2-carboxylate isomerase
MRSTISAALIVSMTVTSLSAAGIAPASKVSWRKVQQLSPGTAITVTATGTSPRSCYVLAADETTLRILSVSDLGLAPDTVKLLRQAAAADPAAFVVGPGAALELGKDVLLRSSGLFVDGHRVADYDQVVQTVARADVESGAVLLAGAQVKSGMETSTKLVMAAGIPLAAYVAFYVFMKAAFK